MTPGVRSATRQVGASRIGESGCVAPTFASAGGHFNPGAATHGDHAGDMPSILVVAANGRRTGRLVFTSDRFTSSDVRGRAADRVDHRVGDDRLVTVLSTPKPRPAKRGSDAMARGRRRPTTHPTVFQRTNRR